MKSETIKQISYIILIILAGVILGCGITINLNQGDGEINYTTDGTLNLKLSNEQVPALIQDDQGEIKEENVPTVEEVDGGLFEDITDELDGEYGDQGWNETYNVSSPEAFKNDTLGQCVIANNRYGAQCVSLARVFWWSYAGRDVSTCGTGMAKGMMNCYEQNAGNDFDVFWNEPDKIQTGDWLIFNGGQYGHVGMALGPVNNGYVALLGENQGGHSCDTGIGGSATNVINISVKNLIGFYRPKSYEKTEPEPEPTSDNGTVKYTYKKGDYFSKVLVELGLDEGNLWGENGTVAKYTKQLIAQNMLDNNGNVIIDVEFELVK